METEFREKPFSVRSEIGTHKAGRETFLIRLFASNAAIRQRGSSVRVRMGPCLFIPPQWYLFYHFIYSPITSLHQVTALKPTHSQKYQAASPLSFLQMRTYTVQPTHTRPNTILNGYSHSMPKEPKKT